MIPPAALKGGATLRGGEPQPAGRPTEAAEKVCPGCAQRTCGCNHPVANYIHQWTMTQGIPLPARMCRRLVRDLQKEGHL